MTGSGSFVARGWKWRKDRGEEWEEGLRKKGQEETSDDDGHVHCLNCDDSTVAHMSKFTELYTLNM